MDLTPYSGNGRAIRRSFPQQIANVVIDRLREVNNAGSPIQIASDIASGKRAHPGYFFASNRPAKKTKTRETLKDAPASSSTKNIESGPKMRSSTKVVRRARSSRYKGRSRRKRISRRARRLRTARGGGGRAGVARRNARGLAGGYSLIGPVDEEDKHVKRHQRYGIIQEYGKSGTLNNSTGTLHGGWIIHSTCPQTTFMVSVCMSIIKKAFNYVGISIKNFNEQVVLPSGINPTVMSVFITYYIGNQIKYIVTNNTLAGTTYKDLADGLTNNILSLTPDTVQSITKLDTLYIYKDTAPTDPALPDNTSIIAKLDMDCMKFNIDVAANLVYQNRSVADDTATSALDIDQQPLFEVGTIGHGNGPIFVSTPKSASYDAFTDKIFGIDTINSGSDAFLLCEPTKATFTNAKKIYNTISAPGVVRQSKLKSHYKFHNLWDIMMKIFAYNTANSTRALLGKWKALWFRKTIAQSGGQAISVAFQHHYAVGCTCIYKRDNRTAPFLTSAY